MIAKFMSEGKNNGFALRAGGTGDVTESHKLWNKTKGLPYIASAIAYRGQYVMVKDGGIVTAVDAKTGDEIYQKRAVAAGTYYASPVAAGGQIYFTTLNDGVVTVLKAVLPHRKWWPKTRRSASASPRRRRLPRTRSTSARPGICMRLAVGSKHCDLPAGIVVAEFTKNLTEK